MRRLATGWIDEAMSDALPGLSALVASAVPTALYRVDGRVVLANDVMFELIGHRPDVVFARGWIPLIYPDSVDQQATLARTEELSRGAPPMRHQRQVVRGDGVRRLIEIASAGYQLPDGGAVITTCTDVTDQWIVMGSGLSDLVEGAPDVLSRIDVRTGRFLFVSRGIQRTLGFSPEEIYADPTLLPGRILPEYRARFDETVRRVVEGPQSLVVGVRHRDGSVLLVQQSLYPVRDSNGRVVTVEGLARDVTAARALERRLKETSEELELRNNELSSLDRMKSRLLANVSHELRTPLVSIKGYTELVLQGALGALTPRQRRGLEIAYHNTVRLVELIETLLDFARREEGRLQLRREHTDVRLAIREAAGQLGGRMAERQIGLSIDLPSSSLPVNGDPARLQQLFKVLLSNAEKFCEDGGAIRVVAFIETGVESDQVAVEVYDTGIGIPEDQTEKIFERFYQVDASATRRFGGAGLGLALAKEIVELHNGSIEVADSIEGLGSTFVVRLPALAGAESTDRGQPVALVAATAAGWPRVRDLLDDEVVVLRADSPLEVVRRSRRHRPDVVVLALPTGANAEAAAELRRESEGSDIPIIAFTEVGQGGLLLDRVDFVVEWSTGGSATESVGEALRSALRRAVNLDVGSGVDVTPARSGVTPRRVVIVDDEPENLDFQRFVLEREGFEVTCVASGKLALERVDRTCDLVILDLAMDGLDGIEVCRRLKSQPLTRDVPVMVVTAMSGEDIRRTSFSAGAEGFLLKPFGVAEFLRQVRLHVRSPALVTAAQNS